MQRPLHTATPEPPAGSSMHAQVVCCDRRAPRIDFVRGASQLCQRHNESRRAASKCIRKSAFRCTFRVRRSKADHEGDVSLRLPGDPRAAAVVCAVLLGGTRGGQLLPSPPVASIHRFAALGNRSLGEGVFSQGRRSSSSGFTAYRDERFVPRPSAGGGQQPVKVPRYSPAPYLAQPPNSVLAVPSHKQRAPHSTSPWRA
jgi:hypothetical protein